MRVVTSINKVESIVKKIKGKNKTIGLVPTMGALHRGHLSLISRARRDNDCVFVSIFVNPKQFGQGEDFKHYPRSLGKDAELCRKLGVDYIFCPSAKEIYPQGYATYIEVEGLSDTLCGL